MISVYSKVSVNIVSSGERLSNNDDQILLFLFFCCSFNRMQMRSVFLLCLINRFVAEESDLLFLLAFFKIEESEFSLNCQLLRSLSLPMNLKHLPRETASHLFTHLPFSFCLVY